MCVRLNTVAPAVGLWVCTLAFGGADRLAAAAAVVRSVAAVVCGCAAADFPADEACVRRQQVPVRTLARGSFGGRHTESFAHLFDQW